MNVISKGRTLLFGALSMTGAVAMPPGPTAIIVQEEINDQVSIARFAISQESPPYKSYDIWRSAQGISCSVASLQSGAGELHGTIECVSSSGYKAQTSFSCLVNRSLESGAYLFFGKVGAKGENKNFTVWCE